MSYNTKILLIASTTFFVVGFIVQQIISVLGLPSLVLIGLSLVAFTVFGFRAGTSMSEKDYKMKEDSLLDENEKLFCDIEELKSCLSK